MKIYKVERPNGDWGYDEYDGFVVVVAESEDAARNTHPDPSGLGEHNRHRGTWPVDLSTLVVTEIGVASPDIKPGVVLASFTAG